MPNIKKDGSFSKRHRGVYTPGHPAPYELSRGRVENFLQCKACFWLEQLRGVKPPEIPSYTLNTTTDILLKRDADRVRGMAALPLWQAHGLGHLIPFEHEHLERWTNSLQYGLNETYFNHVHADTNIKLGGGIDDVFLNTETGQLHIVDYKSEAQGTRNPQSYAPEPSSIDKPWKISYRRQMDMYVWVARNKGLNVADTGYFVYVNAMHVGRDGMLIDADPSKAWLEFATTIIPYRANTQWIEPTLVEIKAFLEQQTDCPEHTPAARGYGGCDVGRYAQQMMQALDQA